MAKAEIFAPALRDYYVKYFNNFRESYYDLYSESGFENLYSKDGNNSADIFYAKDIYNIVVKYNKNIPMETLANTIYNNIENGDFLSLMIARMVASDNLIKNCSLDEDMFSNLNIEDNVGAAQMITIYNKFIKIFKSEVFYLDDFERFLEEMKINNKISEEEYNKSKFLIENYDKFQELIDASINLDDKCGDAVDYINFFDGNGNIQGYEILTNDVLFYDMSKLYNDLDNYYENVINENLDNIWKNLRDGADTIGNFIKKQYENWKDGVEIIQGWLVKDTAKRIQKSFSTARVTGFDPLIFDLDGDGYNVETKDNGANFDLDKNGFAEKINWTSRDGFLCLDLNGNGTIDNGGELFGDQTLLANGTRAKNGFEALARYDSNGDGVIDAGDEIFDSLRIWVDADGNGISGEGELKTLAELGIASINLNYENISLETGTEATIGGTAAFTREDGTTGGVGALWVSSDLFDTVDNISVEISDEIKELPNMRSLGNVYSLHNAMALDETGELKALVESFVSEEDADKRMEITEQILFFISGANNVAADSRGIYIDARRLAVIEAALGEKYIGTLGEDPHSAAEPMLKSAYQDLFNMYYNELNVQTHIKDYAALLRYTENDDGTKTLNADLVNYILEYQLENGDESAKKTLTEVARYVQYLDNGGITGFNTFVMNYAMISAEYVSEIAKFMPNGYAADGENPLKGANNSDFLVGSNAADEMYGYSGNDILIGGKGSDYLYGGYGDDTYIFNLGDGNDIINEQNAGSANDRVVFGEGISAEDVEFLRSGDDMLVRIKGSEDSIRIVSQYNGSWSWVENFEFADGTVINLQDLLSTTTLTGSGLIKDFTSGFGNRNSTLIGSDGTDEIYGYDGNDTLIGGKGSDYLYGGYGDDTYIFNLGDGNDIINEQNAGSANDRVVFGEGISAEDVEFLRSGGDMLVKIKGSEDSIRIVSQYNGGWSLIENFTTFDGYSISNTQVNLLIQSMAAFEADTGMTWAEAAEQPTEKYSDIISQMWVKTA